MILKVLPSTLSGDNVWAPPSKSIMQRALALATFAEGTTMLRRPSESDDCTQAMMMSAQLGATLELGDDAVRSLNIFGKETGCETKLRGVCALNDFVFIVKAENTHHRAKDFFSDNFH